ncbi:anti-anti-sigma factor [Mycobacteriaceae bacterium 1482268.1]|nr:anti-anti-sigma factor [Mycobacteriaceae bacterium 1482268.1]
MSTPLNLNTVRREDGELVLTAAGEVDLSNIQAFSDALQAATTEAADRSETLTVDLSALGYLDSAAVNALCTRAEHIHIIAHPLLMSIFAISGLTELATVEPAPPTAGN